VDKRRPAEDKGVRPSDGGEYVQAWTGSRVRCHLFAWRHARFSGVKKTMRVGIADGFQDPFLAR